MDYITTVWLAAYGRPDLKTTHTATIEGIFKDGVLVWKNAHGHIRRERVEKDGAVRWVIPQSVIDETLVAIPKAEEVQNGTS